MATRCDRECDVGGDELSREGRVMSPSELNTEGKKGEVKTARDEVYIVAGSSRP